VWNVSPLNLKGDFLKKESKFLELIKETLEFYGFMGGRDKTGTVVVNFNQKLKYL
jgi:hypothetical protein